MNEVRRKLFPHKNIVEEARANMDDIYQPLGPTFSFSHSDTFFHSAPFFYSFPLFSPGPNFLLGSLFHSAHDVSKQLYMPIVKKNLFGSILRIFGGTINIFGYILVS